MFIPVQGGTLERVPRKLTTGAYLKYLTISKTRRPVLRNYTVRAFRPDGPQGPELDIDFVLHGSAADGTAGPAATEAGHPDEPFYGWTVGEQTLPTRMRRHWVEAGVPKEHIMFCGGR